MVIDEMEEGQGQRVLGGADVGSLPDVGNELGVKSHQMWEINRGNENKINLEGPKASGGRL